ncbi:MAG: protein kinase [Kofleriaceae bacterium]|nr:protein kinase [Kofleriaceae bacterium]
MEDSRERFGKYHVLERIAQGGMAEVYKVKTVGIAGFEKIQALKRILPDSAQEDRFIRSFIDEARIAVELNHRNIVSVFDFGKAEGELYLAMELIEGKDLRGAVSDAKDRGTLIPPNVAAYVISEVAAGLDYAHRKTDGIGGAMGIVHCDISPSNIMLSWDGGVKILDFGIARASFSSALERRRLRGKPRYMAPEQTRGDSPTSATDVFALGIITWELFTGQALFRGPDLRAILASVRNTVPARLDHLGIAVPTEISDAVAVALSADPGARGSVNDLGIACARLGMTSGARGVSEWLAQTAADMEVVPAWHLAPSSNASLSVPDHGAVAVALPVDEPAHLPPVRSNTVTMELPQNATAPTPSAPATPVQATPANVATPSLVKQLAQAVRLDTMPVGMGPTALPDFDGNATHTSVIGDEDVISAQIISLRRAESFESIVVPQNTSLSQAVLRNSIDAIDDGGMREVDAGVSERRRIVVAFALLDGGPADSLRLLTRSLGELAYQRGGVVIALEERGILVAFGLEIAGEDDVAMAMAWSLDASAMARDASGDRAPASVRIGARTGVTTQPGAGTSRIPEDAIDEVRALARDAVPDRPLFVGGTGRLTSALYTLREVPPRRGAVRRVKVLEVVGPRSFDERDRALFERRGKFVGRGRDLLELDNLYQQSLRQGQRHTALVRGGVGAGKSRLVAELVARLAGTLAPTVVAASAGSANRLSPFSLIVELCQALVGTAPARGRAARSKLSQLIVAQLRAGGTNEELARAAASDIDRAMELRDGVGIGATEPADLRNRVSVAYHAIRYARRHIGRGSVTIIEDLHQADAASLEVLKHALAMRIPGGELLLLTTRDEGPRPPPVDLVVELGDLVGAELRSLIIDRLGPAATPLNVAAVLSRAGGNPLFIEELASAVGQDADEIPATARDVVAARVDRLSSNAKTALRYAAVMAGSVRARLLEELMATDLSAELEELAAERLLVRSDAASPEANEGELHFPRGLVREVVYESLATRAQRDTHARVGRLLASRFFAGREEPPALIAEHLEQGGDTSGAAAFWVRAGRLALAAADADGAVAHFTRVLDLERELGAAPPSLASRARRREALLGREEAHRLQGDLTSHEGDLAELLLLCDDDAERMADIACRSAQRLLRQANYPAAHAATLQAESYAESAGSTRLRGVSLKLRGEVAERQGRFDDALTLVAAARDLFATSGDMIDETAAMVGAGRIHLMRSHYEAAQAAYRPVIDRMKNGADPWLERIVKLHVAAIQMSLGNFADAADSAERSLELCRRYGDRAREGDALSVLAIIRAEAGQYDAAATTFAQALEMLERTNSRWSHTDCLIYAGASDAKRGDRGGLLRIEQGLLDARELGAQYLETNALVAQAGAFLEFDQFDDAVAAAQAGSELARQATLTGAEVLGLARLAYAHSQLGATREAVTAMFRAVHLLEEHLHIEGSEEEVWWRCGEVALMADDRVRATAMFERGYQGFLRKLEWLTDPDEREQFAAIRCNRELTARVPP